jgi:thiamine-monophosphate kinase
MKKNKEELFISLIAKSSLEGDDGAYSNGFVYSKDAFFEDIHFKKEWLSYKQIAIKSSLVNISDAIAMNARPKYALLSIAMPKSITKTQIKELTDGFLEMSKKYNYEIIGGDTIANTKLDITMTIISTTKNPIFRKGMKEGDLVAFTGNLGTTKRDLERLFKGKKISKNSKFITPILRDKFMYRASRYINSALDISDGLFKELERLSKINKKGYKFFKNFDKNIGCSGEEYELLFTFSPKHLKYIQNIAKVTKTPITIFAQVKQGNYKSICKENHF